LAAGYGSNLLPPRLAFALQAADALLHACCFSKEPPRQAFACPPQDSPLPATFSHAQRLTARLRAFVTSPVEWERTDLHGSGREPCLRSPSPATRSRNHRTSRSLGSPLSRRPRRAARLAASSRYCRDNQSGRDTRPRDGWNMPPAALAAGRSRVASEDAAHTAGLPPLLEGPGQSALPDLSPVARDHPEARSALTYSS
jgi:hypothetical protein